MLAEGIEQLAELQERLYASDRWSVLIVLQAMDAAGKDGDIKHVMTGLNPQGVEVHAFKQPSTEDSSTISSGAPAGLPARPIGIFNRSHYEEVLVVRVHPKCSNGEHFPRNTTARTSGTSASKTSTPQAPYRAHRHLVLKFFVDVSHKEQRRRFL